MSLTEGTATIFIKQFNSNSPNDCTYSFQPSDHAKKYMESLDKWERESEEKKIVVSGPLGKKFSKKQ